VNVGGSEKFARKLHGAANGATTLSISKLIDIQHNWLICDTQHK